MKWASHLKTKQNKKKPRILANDKIRAFKYNIVLQKTCICLLKIDMFSMLKEFSDIGHDINNEHDLDVF